MDTETHYSPEDIQDILVQYADAFFSDGDLRSESDEDLSQTAQNMLDDLNNSVICAGTTIIMQEMYISEQEMKPAPKGLKCAYYHCFEPSSNIIHSDYASAIVYGGIRNYCSAPCMRRDLQSYNDLNNVVPRPRAPVIQKYISHLGFSVVWNSDLLTKFRPR